MRQGEAVFVDSGALIALALSRDHPVDTVAFSADPNARGILAERAIR
jgi:hypothetical protein